MNCRCGMKFYTGKKKLCIWNKNNRPIIKVQKLEEMIMSMRSGKKYNSVGRY